MGRIKQTYLKRVAEKLVKAHESDFSVDFDVNKKKVEEYTDIESRSDRNKIAGCITRIVRTREEKTE